MKHQDSWFKQQKNWRLSFFPSITKGCRFNSLARLPLGTDCNMLETQSFENISPLNCPPPLKCLCKYALYLHKQGKPGYSLQLFNWTLQLKWRCLQKSCWCDFVSFLFAFQCFVRAWGNSVPDWVGLLTCLMSFAWPCKILFFCITKKLILAACKCIFLVILTDFLSLGSFWLPPKVQKHARKANLGIKIVFRCESETHLSRFFFYINSTQK